MKIYIKISIYYLVSALILVLCSGISDTEARSRIKKRKHVVHANLPLREMYYIPSTFAEHREDHFHAGVDFGTRMQIGEPVYAYEEGEIYRIKYQKRGYGKVLYLRHRNNLISVYAHLDRFENQVLKLENILKNQQDKESKKYVDIYYDHSPVKVKKHQLIAYSGETGDGLPHLHFELRKGETTPVNPFNTYFKETGDKAAPFFQGVILCPEDYNSSINFSKECRTISFVKGYRHDRFQANSVPVIEGKFKIYVSLYDKGDSLYWRAPKYIWFYIDGKLAFKISNSIFSYTDNTAIGYYFDQGMHGPWEFNVPVELCNSEAKKLTPVTYCSKSLCAMDLGMGTHNFKIMAADANMNMSTALLSITKIARPESILLADVEKMEACFAFKSAKRPDKIVVPSIADSAMKAEYWDFSENAFKKYVPEFSHAKCGLKFTIPVVMEKYYYVRISYLLGNQWSPWAIAYTMNNNAISHAPQQEVTGKPGIQYDIYTADEVSNQKTEFQVKWSFEYGKDYLFFKAVPCQDIPVFLTGKCTAADGKESSINFSHGGMTGIMSTVKIDSASGTLKCEVNDSIGKQQWFFSFDINYIDKNVDSLLSWRDVKMMVPAGSTAESSYVWLEKIKPEGSFTLPFISDILQFHPRGLPLTRRGLVKINVPDVVKDANKLALYRWQRKKNEWKLILSGYNLAEKTIEGHIHYLDRIAMIYDNVCPSFYPIVPYEGEILAEQPYQFIIQVEEEGMGLDDDNLIFILDYERIPAEYDPDRDSAYIVVPRKLKPGPHILRVVGRDYAMNDATPLAINFTIK